VRIVAVVGAAREEGVSEEGGSPRAPPPLQYLSKVKASMVGRASIPKWAQREREIWIVGEKREEKRSDFLS